jgi:hypothetical protein
VVSATVPPQEQWAKINIDRKRSSYIEKNCFQKSQYCSTGDRTAEMNTHLEDLFPQKLSDVNFTNPTSTLVVGLQLLSLSLLKAMLRCVNDGVMTMKPGHQTTGNACVVRSDESSFTLLSTSGRVYVWRTPKEAYNPERLVSTVKHVGRFCDCLDSNIVVQYSAGPITAREYVDRLSNQVHPMIQTLFPNNDAGYQDDSSPIHTAGTVQSWSEEHEGKLQHLPRPA